MATLKNLGLFDAVGIEIEYMIVDQHSLDIRPISDLILQHLSKPHKKVQNEIQLGEIAISNELVMHVIELKTNGPKKFTENMDIAFAQTVCHINDYLADLSCELLPTGAHPLLESNSPDIKLWPHGDKTIYEAYNAIFNCQGHGWSNLQSMHINLPFSSDIEFYKLHNAIRTILPIIPALTASTPLLEGNMNRALDNRLLFYGNNQATIPQISGLIIPEVVKNKSEYLSTILEPMYNAISPFDPNKTLQHEWLNSRGAIARFDRNAIEIRIVDSQECPQADIACASAIIGVLKYLIYDTIAYIESPMNSKQLYDIYNDTIHSGLNTVINNEDYCSQFNISATFSTRELWTSLLDKAQNYIDSQYLDVVSNILEAGNLSERITKTLNKDASVSTIKDTYKKLSTCLQENKLFL